MKTQLLEDIGQSTTLPLEPSGEVSNAGAHKGGQDTAQAPAPVRRRSAFGVWRQKPEDEPMVLATQQPEQAAPPEASLAFAPTAVEAQHIPPQPVHELAIPPAEPTLAAKAPQSEPMRHDPMFDFMPLSAATPARDLLEREPSWFKRSGQRYLLWGSCAIAGALAIQAGWHSYQGRKDAGVVAPVASEVTAKPRLDKAVKRRANGAKEFSLGPDGIVRMAHAPLAAPALSPSDPPAAQAIPPLVLLAPEPATVTKVKPAAALAVDQKDLQAPSKPERVAARAPATPLPKRMHRTEREQWIPAPKPARARMERVPVRQLVREPVMQAEKKSEAESTMTATLKACREHGYQATQCVKRGCSVTKYGFVCRG